LKGGAQLLVAPLGQDFIEGKLGSAPATFACLRAECKHRDKNWGKHTEHTLPLTLDRRAAKRGVI